MTVAPERARAPRAPGSVHVSATALLFAVDEAPESRDATEAPAAPRGRDARASIEHPRHPDVPKGPE